MTERTSAPAKGKTTPRRAKRPPAEPPRQARARAVAEMLPDVGGAAFRRFGFVQSAVVSRWPEIVGARYAAVSTPESIRFPRGEKSGGTLTLGVEGAHATMMQHVAPTLIERVNRFFGYTAVARVLIRQGAARPRPAPPRPVTPPPPAADLGDSLRAIGDPELRAVLESLALGLSLTAGAPRLPEQAE
ncbi:MAG TPA: DciA family protein [Sphingomonas sp.]